MKKLKIAGLSALTLLGSLATSQAQATTAPVGYVTLASASNPIPANTDVRLSVPMEASVDFTGLATSATGNELTVTGAAFTANQFAPATGGYYLRIKNGTSKGQTAEITANTTNVLTLALETGDDLTNVDSTTQIEIVKYFTLSTFFPASLPSGTKVLFFSNATGVNKASSSIVSWNGTVWRQGFTNVDAPLYPGESFILRTGTSPVTDLVITGHVPTVSHRIILESLDSNQQDFSVSYLSPVAEKIGNTGIGFSNGDKLLVFDRTPGVNKAATQTLSFNGTIWRAGFTDVSNTFEIEPGVGYILRRAAASQGTTKWSNTQSYNQ